MEVGGWLRNLGLGQYEWHSATDAEILSKLTADDLIGLGVSSIGHRRKLLAAIAALRTGPPTVAQPPQAAREEVEPGRSPTSFEAERRQLTVMFVDLVGSNRPLGAA
jgi:hypothetical protein